MDDNKDKRIELIKEEREDGGEGIREKERIRGRALRMIMWVDSRFLQHVLTHHNAYTPCCV